MNYSEFVLSEDELNSSQSVIESLVSEIRISSTMDIGKVYAKATRMTPGQKKAAMAIVMRGTKTIKDGFIGSSSISGLMTGLVRGLIAKPDDLTASRILKLYAPFIARFPVKDDMPFMTINPDAGRFWCPVAAMFCAAMWMNLEWQAVYIKTMAILDFETARKNANTIIQEKKDSRTFIGSIIKLVIRKSPIVLYELDDYSDTTRNGYVAYAEELVGQVSNEMVIRLLESSVLLPPMKNLLPAGAIAAPTTTPFVPPADSSTTMVPVPTVTTGGKAPPKGTVASPAFKEVEPTQANTPKLPDETNKKFRARVQTLKAEYELRKMKAAEKSVEAEESEGGEEEKKE